MERLLEEFPPTREAATVDWQSAEEELGLAVPDSCRTLIETYGEARFDDFISILLPASRNENLDAVRRTKEIWWALEESDDEDDAEFLQDHGLAIRDLVAWAVTGNGDFCFAANSAKASGMTIVCDPRESDWEAFQVDPGDFLGQVLVGELSCSVFPASFPTDEPAFYYL